MISLGVISAGHHSRAFHLPALRAFQAHFPNTIRLSVLCDRHISLAGEVAREFGFESVESDYVTMGKKHKLDGCLVLTQPSTTLEAALHILETSRASVLIEKPLGETLEQTQAFIKRMGQNEQRVMVSLNRRFDPALLEAKAWLEGRKVDYLRVTMARANRSESDFMWTTGIHVVDAAMAMTGQPKTWEIAFAHDGRGPHGIVTFDAGGTLVHIDILPVTGVHQETFEFFGSDFHVRVKTGQVGSGAFQAWEKATQTIAKTGALGSEEYLTNGTYGETVRFVSALQGRETLAPSVMDVLTATSICSELHMAATSGTRLHSPQAARSPGAVKSPPGASKF